MTRPVVLTEKLRRPEPVGLARRRLEELLLAPSTSRLDLVVAPPGSGKTTLLARVAAAAQTAGSAVGWYRVTADDASEPAFVAHLARALHLDTAPDDSSVTDMLELLDRSPTAPTLVVFDDVHEIAGSPAERALDQFVQLRPPHLRVLVGCRRPPELNIPRLRVSGHLREITSDDLRFRSWEVEELFLSVFREPLSPESAAALTRRTGGWAAGLQLFHLATSGRSAVDRGRAVDDLGGRSKLVRSYLARNVLAELPEERRHFLLRTCTLGTLTGPLCDALLGMTGSSAILDELEHRQLFTSSDDDGHTFRYHEVLRTHLEWALVQEYGAAGAREWYSRSAALLESVGDQRSAVRAYARAEDWGAVGRLLQTRGTGPDAGAAGTDLLLPPAVVEHDPWLSLAQARRRVREGALTAAVDRFRRAESLLDEPDFRDDCQRERSVAAMWASTDTTGMSWAVDGRGSARHWSIPIRLATRRLGTARLAPPVPPGPTPAPHELARGIISLLAGDFRDARRTLDTVVADRTAESTHRLLADLTIAVIDLIRDRAGDPANRLGQIALDAEVAGLPWIARLARGMGECVLAATDPAAWRLAACVDQIDECDEAGDAWGAALLTLAAAVTGLIADPAAEAHGFADAAARFRRLDAPVPALWAQALQACALAGRRRPGAAELAGRVATEARAAQVTGAQSLAQIAAVMAGAPVGTEPEPTGSDLDRMITLLAGGGAATAATPPETEPATTTTTTTGTAGASPAIPAGGSGPAPDAVARTVVVRCLGGFAVEIDGRAVDLAPLRPRARALLRLLAMTPNRDVHREHLVDALWPGTDLTVGTRRLQVAVSSVRQLLEQRGLPGGEVVLRHGDAYRLALPAGAVVDTETFERGLREADGAAARGEIAAAATVRGSALSWYRGDLLPEDGPAEHVVGERERLRLLAATAAATLARDYRTLGQLRQAVAAARQSVQLDRYQDLAWELLADLHRDAGDDSAAARTRREHAAAQAELELDSVRP